MNRNQTAFALSRMVVACRENAATLSEMLDDLPASSASLVRVRNGFHAAREAAEAHMRWLGEDAEQERFVDACSANAEDLVGDFGARTDPAAPSDT